MKKYLIPFFLPALLLMGCSPKPANQIEPTKSFTFSSALNLTPVENAQNRYTDFQYHYRFTGEQNFKTVAPEKISLTKDKSIMVKFSITVPDPQIDRGFESFYSYKFDGKEEFSYNPTTTLASTGTK